jgi:NTE family protein
MNDIDDVNKLNQIKEINEGIKNIDTVMFGGAAFRAIFYIGIIKSLKELNILENLKNIYGSSAGSFCGLAMILGYRTEEFTKISKKLHPKLYYNIYAESIINFDTNYSFDDGLKFMGIIRELFVHKNINPYITFKELYKKIPVSFHVNTAIVNNKTCKIYNHIDTPDFMVANAIYASMSIPFFIKPIIIDGDMHIDGSFINDFPLEYAKNIDEHYSNILCFKSINKNQENKLKSIFKNKYDTNFNNDLGEYINLIMGTLMKNNFIYEKFDDNIIKIDFHEINLFDYEYTDEKIDIVIEKSYNQSTEQINNCIKKLNNKKKIKKKIILVDKSTQTY